MSFLDLLRNYGAPDDIIALAERLTAATTPDTTTDAPADDRLLQYPDETEPLTYDELGTLDDYVAALGNDENAPLELIVAAVDIKDRIVGEVEAHDEIAQAAEAQRAEAAAKLTGNRPAGENDPDSTDEDGGDPDSTDEDGGDGGEPAGQEEEAEEEPVAAASGRTVSRSAILANRTRSNRPRNKGGNDDPTPAPAGPALSRFEFHHGVPDPTGGAGWTTKLSNVDKALVDKRATWRGGKPSANGVKEDVPVATLRGTFPENRKLIDGDGKMLAPSHVSNIVTNAIEEGRAETLRNRNGLVAAGGLCSDIATPIYTLETYGVTSRPIRDQALVSFQGQPRGRVEAQSPPTLGDVEDGVSIWTVTDDENASDPEGDYYSEKPCVRVVCGDPINCELHTVPVCLNMGNFLARSFPELQAAWTRLSMVAQARIAEQELFTQMTNQATTIATTTETVSAVRDTLATVDQAAAGIRSRNRMEANDPMIVVLPETFRVIARTDIARQMPGGPTQGNLAVADSMILEWFSSRFLSPVWSMDLNLIGAQTDGGALAALPANIDALVYPAGTFIHVDGGQLDLGLVRDTTTNATNDFQIFSESFECVLQLGPEALHLDIEVCPSGAVSGTITPPACE